MSTPPPAAASRPTERPLVALSSVLAELHLTRVVPTLWCIGSHRPARFRFTPSHCVVEGVDSCTEETAWDDVLGAHVLTADGQPIDAAVDDSAGADPTYASFVLTVYVCGPQQLRSPKTLKKRKTSEFVFRCTTQQLPQVVRLQQCINFLADPRNQERRQQVETLDDLELVERPARKYLVLVNPVSGPGTCSIESTSAEWREVCADSVCCC